MLVFVQAVDALDSGSLLCAGILPLIGGNTCPHGDPVRARNQTGAMSVRVYWVPLLPLVFLVATSFCLHTSEAGGRTNRLAPGQHPVTLTGHTSSVLSLAISPDGKTLASASNDRTIRLWDISARKEQRRLIGHHGAVAAVIYSPDGRMLASGSYDRTVKLWEVATGRERASFAGHHASVHALAFSHNVRILATRSCDDTTKVWDLPTGKERATLREPWALRSSVVTFTPDGKSLLIAGDTTDSLTVSVWEVSTGRLTTRQLWFDRAETFGAAFSLAFSPDCKICASGHGGNLASFMKSEKAKAKGWEFIQNLTDAATGAGNVKVWRLTEQKGLPTLKGHSMPVVALAFSHDGRTLASGDDHGAVKVWDTAMGKKLGDLLGSGSSVCCLTFSPDGKLLATSGLDGVIRVWTLRR